MKAPVRRVRRINACGLEPVSMAREALARLAPGEQLCILVEHEPFSLYRVLSNNAWAYCTNAIHDALYEVIIWRCGAQASAIKWQ